MYSEDQEFVERILAGQPGAFEPLVRKYQRMAGAIAYAIVGDFHLAEDVVQESFLKALRSLPSLREHDRFKSWFAGMVRMKALDALRKRRAHGTVPVSEGLTRDGVSGGPSPVEESRMREELQEKVRDAIRELPEQDRIVVVLKHLEGLSYKEIAEVLGMTVSAVESRLFRARQALKSKLPAGRL